MKTIRRLYFYAVSAISIEVILWGVIGLLRSILDSQDISNNANNLASALALIFVGVPIFLIHWGWAHNVSSKDPEEHSASIRAVFLYGILLGTLIPVVQNLLALINRTFLSTVHLSSYRAVVGGSQTWSDNLIAIIINLLIAAYFWNVLRTNWKTITEPESFAEVRRLYRFVWVLYGLLMAVYGVQQAISYAFSFPTGVLGEIGRETAVNSIALMLIGTPIWYYNWRLLQDALTDSDEKESYLRLGLLYLLALGSVFVFLGSFGDLLYQSFLQMLGDGKATSEFIREMGSAISVAVPFGVVWAYYSKWLNQQFAFDENLPRRAGKHRLYVYILSFVGLIATIGGLISLFSALIDLVLGNRYLSDYGLREPLAGAFSSLLVGLPVWLLNWRTAQSQALADNDMGDHARRSVIRKAYLYLVLFASVIGGMVTAGILVFNLINSALGNGISDFWTEVLNQVLVLSLFIVLLVYHLLALRADGTARADVLVEKQSKYHVAVLDADGKFGNAIKVAFAKRAPQVPLTVVDVNSGIPAELKVDAVILPGSLVVNTPETVEAWVRSFSGNKLIVSDEAVGVFWMDDFEQAADSAKSLAEGQDLRPQSSKRTTSIWTVVAYVFAALFACQLLFGLLMFGVSMVTGF